MLNDHVLSLAQQVNPKAEPNDIIELSGGFSSQAYKINIPSDPFVLLVERAGAVSHANYGHAYVVLTLLQKHKLQHAPQPLWLEANHNALAISYFDGIASDEFNFAAAHVDTQKLSVDVIDSLLSTAVVTIDEYKDQAKELHVKPLPILTAKDGAREYGTDWFKIVKQSCPNKAIVAWLEPRVEGMEAAAETIGHNNKPTLGLGDPSNPNILINNSGQFMLIDWDSARFHTGGPEFYVDYTTTLTDFMKPYRQMLIEHVANQLNIPTQEFANKVDEYRRFSGVGDVNWAAMMMAKVYSGEIEGDVAYFKNIALERITLYEQSFGQ